MSREQDQDNARRARAREVGLFRYALIQDALNEALSTKQRGRLVRATAARTHPGRSGHRCGCPAPRWIGGSATTAPAGSPRWSQPRGGLAGTPAQVLELAVALKTEAPDRTAAQVAVILAAHGGVVPSARTLQRHFAAAGLTRSRPDGAPLAVFGRFEAERPNVRWVGDALHGPHIAGRKAILIAFLDDHSRAVVAARWGYAENAVALRETLGSGWPRGCPAQCYVDNGSMFIDSGLRRACAVLGIRLVHSRPAMPAGRGKIERFFKTVRDQFLVEISAHPDDPSSAGTVVASLAELNTLFTAWVEQVYHQRIHSETRMPPLARFLAAGPPVPTPAGLLGEAFRWGEWRTVTKTATVSLQGNLYEVDTALAGSKVELVFDPFDLTDIDVRHHGRPAGRLSRSGSASTSTPKRTPTPHRPGPDRDRLPAPGRGPTQTRPRPAASVRAADRSDPRPPSPPADANGLAYDTDLLALASPGPPDPQLDAELASFAALLTAAHTDSSTLHYPDRPRSPGEPGPARVVLRVHPHPVPPGPGPLDAAPPRRARRSGRPDPLVHQRERPRRHHR